MDSWEREDGSFGKEKVAIFVSRCSFCKHHGYTYGAIHDKLAHPQSLICITL